ncbi:MAG: hypothetical protein SPF56_06870 [Bacteroidaceae bacterium]|nr:hypothetical protein [Bacteroidaceae bacterium]
MRKLLYIALACMLAGCGRVSAPEEFTESRDSARVYPAYQDVVVPRNLAPLTFHVENKADRVICVLGDGRQSFAYEGPDIEPAAKEWRMLDGQVSVDTYVKNNDRWSKLRSFTFTISNDSIDPYISYRLISPSYVTYEGLTICQRNLETYDESVIYSNMANSNEKDGQCINCHSYQNYNPDRFQFHVRQAHGGTIIARDGKIERIDMKSDKAISAGVYPAWHPTANLIAYSTNRTGQSFHTHSNQKVEVQDTYSDLILYDVDNHEILPLESDSNQLDCFPHWSPDGRYLYFCSAYYEKKDTSAGVTKEYDMIMNYQDVHYNLYRRSFDLKSKSFGAREMVYDAARDSMSATLPRVSPDGRWLMFTMAPYGVFHIWHKAADLYLMNLESMETRRLEEINSPEVESYHSWSSNNRWVIFSSRRDDGNFTRPFIAHMTPDGRFSRPLELPSRHPLYHRELMRSYNIPEFMSGPVTIRPQDLARAIRQDSTKAK